jgi:hypothetical protein
MFLYKSVAIHVQPVSICTVPSMIPPSICMHYQSSSFTNTLSSTGLRSSPVSSPSGETGHLEFARPNFFPFRCLKPFLSKRLLLLIFVEYLRILSSFDPLLKDTYPDRISYRSFSGRKSDQFLTMLGRFRSDHPSVYFKLLLPRRMSSFTQRSIYFLFRRIRSRAKIKSRMRCSARCVGLC